MHYHYITFDFACITLLYILENNALHYFLNVMHYITHYFSQISNKQNESILVDLLEHIINHILSYKENSLNSLFLISCFSIVVSTKIPMCTRSPI